MAEYDPITVAQFWGRVTVSDMASCWEWHGPIKTNGYGRFRGERAHRVAYKLTKGPIPDDRIIRHTCDNRVCCNPHHLLPGTHQDNSDDAVARGRLSRGSANGNSKLTEDQIRYIRQNPERKTGKELADQFKVAQSTISYIRRGMIWKAA